MGDQMKIEETIDRVKLLLRTRDQHEADKPEDFEPAGNVDIMLVHTKDLRALVDAAEAGRWRGIESAPKDGTSILGAQGSHNEPAVIRWISARSRRS